MALAMHMPAAMGAEAGADRAVHPFFAAVRDRAHSQPPGEQPDAPTEAPDLDAAPQDGVATKGTRAPKRRSDEPSSDRAKGTQAKLDFGLQTNQPAEPYEDVTSASAEPLAEGGEQGVPAENPAKRRKTCSPAPEPASTPIKAMPRLGWEEQLLHAGFAGSSSPAGVEAVATPDVIPQSSPPAPTTSTQQVQVAETPQKKVIRLRTDGRLVSPKAATDSVRRSKRKTGDKDLALDPKRRMVALRYTQHKAREEFGKKIDDVLAGRMRIQSTDKGVGKPKKLRATQPNKPPHPFFTGKASRVDLNAAAHGQPDGSDTTALARSSSPKRKPAPASSWAGFGASFSKQPKLPGSLPAPWPSRDMMHVRGLQEPLSARMSSFDLPSKRLKGSEVRLPASDDVLNPLRMMVASAQSDTLQLPHASFHRPRRRLMTGPELQNIVRKRLVSSLPEQLTDPDQTQSEDELGMPPATRSREPAHGSIRHLYDQLSSSMSAFDLFECEQREWAHKHAPHTVDHVLQGGTELGLLRDWVLSLTVNAVGIKATDSREKAGKKAKAKKKKRRTGDELDDFIVFDEESDDPEYDEAEGTGIQSRLRRLSPRNIPKTKAVVLCGPHGCGKTASVYAAARELGFEIFEINSGVRRSGRDLVDKVGDMTRNHLVRQTKEASEDPEGPEGREKTPTIDAQAEVDSGRQATMNAFFASDSTVKQQSNHPAKKKAQPEQPPPKRPARKQKQSLILLEEVDVLFEEDRHFWSTVISMLLESRRPVILTCTDESLLPVDELTDVAALHLLPASESDSIDHLLLVAANEGHLVSRNAVAELYRAHGDDLRSSLVQMNFLCQMALGDTKGGLEWMLIRSNTEESCNAKGESLRVISEDTFVEQMAITMDKADAEPQPSRTQLSEDLYTLLDAQTNWDVDPEDWLGSTRYSPPPASFEALMRFETATEALSAADCMPGSSLLEPDAALLDTASPALSEKDRANYPDGRTLLDTPLRRDPSDLSLHIVLALKLQARPLLSPPGALSAIDLCDLCDLVLNAPPWLSDLSRSHGLSLASVLSPLSIPPASTVFTNSAFRPSASLLPSTRPCVLAAEVAPLVRGVVAADLRLERDRLRLGGLLSQGGRDGKRARTTRAARAALEGGAKASTRRERWFGRELSYADVLATAGDGWAEAGAREAARREAARVDAEEEESGTAAAEALTDEEVPGGAAASGVDLGKDEELA